MSIKYATDIANIIANLPTDITRIDTILAPGMNLNDPSVRAGTVFRETLERDTVRHYDILEKTKESREFNWLLNALR